MSTLGPFTDNPSQPPGSVFPNQSMQTLSSIIHLFGCSALVLCFARRTMNESLFSWQTWAGMSWPRLCTLLVFIDSWLFLFFTGILIGGAGMSSSSVNCAMGIFACVLLYASSKLLIYLFLIEKVYVVWGGTHQSRSTSRVYWLCMTTMVPYAAVFILMIVGRVAYFRDDRACIIGLKAYASLALLIYDLYINVFLTGMFLWPIFHSRLANPRIRRMAIRTLVAAVAALTTSTINIAILTIMHGQQLGWVCLGSCGTDVTMNALVLFWVTDNVSQSAEHTPGTHGLAAAAAPVPVSQEHHSACQEEEGTLKPVHPRFEPAGAAFEGAGDDKGRVSASTKTRRAVDGKVVFSKQHPGPASSPRGGSLFGRIGDAFRSRDDAEDRRHQLSVQVKIMTEQQEDIMLEDVKYGPQSQSQSMNESIGTRPDSVDTEKASADEMGRQSTVVLPPRD